MSIDPAAAPHVHDPDPFCPAIAGVHPHDFHPYFDLRTVSTFLFCTACGEQKLVLPELQSQVPPPNFGVINNGTQSPAQPTQQPAPGSGIFKP